MYCNSPKYKCYIHLPATYSKSATLASIDALDDDFVTIHVDVLDVDALDDESSYFSMIIQIRIITEMNVGDNNYQKEDLIIQT